MGDLRVTSPVPHRTATVSAPKRDLVAAEAVRPRTRVTGWPTRYASRLFYSDVAVVAVTLGLYSVFAFNDVRSPVLWQDGPSIPYWVFLIIFGLLWLFALDAFDTRDRHTVGHGIVEYRRILDASLVVVAVFVAFAFFFRVEIARSVFVFAVPAGVVGLLLSRWIWRQWLRVQQRHKRYVFRTVVLGEPEKVRHIVDEIRRVHGTGYDIVGAITARSEMGAPLPVDVLGSYSAAVPAIDDVQADTVIVTSADDLSPQKMRRLGWALADRDINLVVAAALTDVAGPRIHAMPVAGLPLVHVDFPRLEGWKRFGKRSFDILGSLALIIAASPILLLTMLAIAIDSRGPLFYTQTRIGRRGRPFEMIKFRSMVANADDQLASLLDLQGTSDSPLFKVTNDPRITRVGKFIRKYSIDELPQLFNVLGGRMSLVGPRPQREAEVALYDEVAHRRLLVKPGMSGLWQVSGRSSLSWEDALRLDLYYVENWSFTQDIQILFRTFKAVIAPGESAH